MANNGKPISKDLINRALGYPFQNSPFGFNMTSEDLGSISLKNYRLLRDKLWDKIAQHIVRRNDEELFKLVQPNLICPTLEDFKRGTQELQINEKTLKSCIEKRSGTDRIRQFFEAFDIVVEAEKEEFGHLQRLAGYYNVYNMHSSNKKEFQASHLFISPELGKSALTYFSRRYKIESRKVDVEVVGSDKLLIVLREENCYLAFYAYVSALEHPKVIQAPFIYNNGAGHTFASMAILQKVDSQKRLVTPFRDKKNWDDIPSGILSDQEKSTLIQFLSNRAHFIRAKLFNGYDVDNRLRFDFDDLLINPGPFRKKAHYYDNSAQYIGKYFIYFNERYPSEEIGDKRKSEDYSTVGKGLLEIYKDPHFGHLKCRMKTRKNRRGEEIVHEGEIINQQLQSPSYLILSMYEKKNNHRYTNLVLMKAQDDYLLGSHSITYSRVGEFGSGAVVVIRQFDTPDDWFETTKPDSELPCKLHENPRMDTVINYLAANRNALISPITQLKDLNKYQNLIHRGVYKMYSYAKGEGIRLGILKIHKSGFVEHYGKSGKKNTIAYGSAFLLRTVLNITLRDVENNRMGFLSIKVAEVGPSNVSDDRHPEISNTVYVGTFCGVTRRTGEYPLASRVILEFKDSDSVVTKEGLAPQIIARESDLFASIPKPIVEALQFRNQSFLDFLGTGKDIFNLKSLQEFNENQVHEGEAYLNAAMMEASKNGESPLYERLMEKAKKHGWQDISHRVEKEREEVAEQLFEQAVYQAVMKQNTIKAKRLLKRARSLTKTPHKLQQQFDREVGLEIDDHRSSV